MEDRKGKKVRRLILFIDSGDTLVDEGSESAIEKRRVHDSAGG